MDGAATVPLAPAAARSNAVLRLLRPHQWVKNTLVFIPLVLSHQTGDLRKIGQATVAFAAFCLCASFGYVVNDLLDVESDRNSPARRDRPIAAGLIRAPAARGIAASLLLVSVLTSTLLLPVTSTAVLLVYAACTVSYSVWLKRRLLVDVIFLASLYTLRLLFGGEAVTLRLTPMLLAFSMFFFLSLAFAKRFVELSNAPGEVDDALRARGYLLGDIEMIRSVGPTAGYLAVLVMAIYINSDMAKLRYHHPAFLWVACPVLLYWITRIWFLAGRGALHDDPILFAIRDRVSLLAGALVATLVGAAAFLP